MTALELIAEMRAILPTEAEREELRARWRELSGSKMAPVATMAAECPECHRAFGVIDGRLNGHAGPGFDGRRCFGSGAAVEGRPL